MVKKKRGEKVKKKRKIMIMTIKTMRILAALVQQSLIEFSCRETLQTDPSV
jgi:hypothetical protein